MLFPAVQYAVAMGLRVLAIGEKNIYSCFMNRWSDFSV